jgi:carbon-monoxide dehydrogenase large subunit
MLHLAFVRSPYAHARVVSVDGSAARSALGVVDVFTAANLNFCAPFVGVAENRPGHKSVPQHVLARDVACWQGQAVAAVVASTRAEAEDAAELVVIEWEPLPAILDGMTALTAPPIHQVLPDNLTYEHNITTGNPEKAFAEAQYVIEHEFDFVRQTGLTLEPRGLIADYDPSVDFLTVYHSHQSPHQMQGVFSRHVGIPEHKVRVIAPDVGGGFGLKVNVYPEEIAVAAISKLLGRPVKFCADRIESFVSDSHARDHKIKARMALGVEGRIHAIEIDDIASVGAYSAHMRFNIAEGMMLVTNTGAPYNFPNYRARTRNVFVNKNLIGMFRGVGIPLSCVVTEVLADLAASELGIDPVDFRRHNYHKKESMPCTTAAGSKLDNLSFNVCLDRLVEAMDYRKLRQQQAALRAEGVYRGIGIATFVEPTAYGPAQYGPTGAPITVQDGCTIRLEPTGALRCVTSVTEQGQGTSASVAQIIADTIGVDITDVNIIGGDSAISAYGGGAWASRGIVYGGEAALKAARELAVNIRGIAAAITQSSPEELVLARGQVINKRTKIPVISIAEVARIGYFRQDTLPHDLDVQLTVTRSHVVNNHSYYMTIGVQGSLLEVDPDTGIISLLDHWAVTDCGRVINPLLVEDQLRGGIVQGIGSVLYEECVYNDVGTLVNGTMSDYLAPMAGEMPDIYVEQIETPERTTLLGAKGVGEAGLIGAMGAVWVAVTDALKPFDARVSQQPFTPERVLEAIWAARSRSHEGEQASV